MQERESNHNTTGPSADGARSGSATLHDGGSGSTGGSELRDRQLHILLRAGEVLGSSLDISETLQQAAGLVVPGLADWCAVDLIDDEEHTARLVAVAHVDPAKVAWARRLRERNPVDLDDEEGVARVVRTGESILAPVVTPAMMQGAADDPGVREILEHMGFRSIIVAPLIARGSVMGALTLVWSDSERHYDEQDVRFAEEFARRAALAVDNARLYEQTQELNATLERRVEMRSRQVQELASEVTVAESRERGRIARLLHDEVQQQLHTLHFQLEELREHAVAGDADRFHATFDETHGALKQVVEEVRTLTSELSPVVLHTEEFADALAWLARRFADQHGLRVEVDAPEGLRFAGEAARELLFSLVRECLFNVVKHAGVEDARVAVRRNEGWVHAVVEDDGDGFDAGRLETERTHATGLGLRSAVQRLEVYNGVLHVESRPERLGARVMISVPEKVLKIEDGAGGE